MSDIHEFAAAVLAAWQSEGHAGNGPIPVGELVDRIFSYPVARRQIGIDVSEDYEALMLRLLAEEGGHASVTPQGAAEMARATMVEKLPDLAVLQLLRGASITLGNIVPALARPMTEPAAAAIAAAPVLTSTTIPAVNTAPATRCWSCDSDLPAGRSVKFCPNCGADQRPPVCVSCQEPLEREWKHCPECGQRVERGAGTMP